jgi:hypothetical protein
MLRMALAVRSTDDLKRKLYGLMSFSGYFSAENSKKKQLSA